jgi:hypothetical protein
MKKKRTKILAGVVLLAGVMLITAIVWAKATKTPIAGRIQVIPGGPEDAERYWVDDEGIVHYRGLPASLFTLDGPLEGTGTAVVNVNYDPVTGNGDESGTITFELTWGELSGTFEGRFSATYTNWVSNSSAVYHGTGDFEGMKMMADATMSLLDFVSAYEGIILDPHGE